MKIELTLPFVVIALGGCVTASGPSSSDKSAIVAEANTQIAYRARPANTPERAPVTENIDFIEIDSGWANYGAYLQRLIDTAQVQWERLLIEQKIYPPSGTVVKVTFILDHEGKISRIVNIESQSTDQAARACVSAIIDRAPYGPWTDEMKKTFGERQEMTMTFRFQ